MIWMMFEAFRLSVTSCAWLFLPMIGIGILACSWRLAYFLLLGGVNNE